jgi:hypothetical protein
MDIVTLVTAAIVSLRPHISGEMIDKYAADISAAVDVECEHDEVDCIELALALVVVQDQESTWRSDVETCKVVGDGGRAVGAYQMHRHWWRGRTRKEICSSNLLAATLAAHTLTVLAGPSGGMETALRHYVGCAKNDPRAVKRRDTLRRLKAVPKVRDTLDIAKRVA